eukprot:15450964-Alexandrium_andersonii.AAC.1
MPGPDDYLVEWIDYALFSPAAWKRVVRRAASQDAGAGEGSAGHDASAAGTAAHDGGPSHPPPPPCLPSP